MCHGHGLGSLGGLHAVEHLEHVLPIHKHRKVAKRGGVDERQVMFDMSRQHGRHLWLDGSVVPVRRGDQQAQPTVDTSPA